MPFSTFLTKVLVFPPLHTTTTFKTTATKKEQEEDEPSRPILSLCCTHPKDPLAYYVLIDYEFNFLFFFGYVM